MSDNNSKEPNKDYFEENLRDILSGGDDCAPPPPRKPAPQNPPPVSKTETVTGRDEPSKKSLFLFSLIRGAAFFIMVALLLMFVCRIMEPR